MTTFDRLFDEASPLIRQGMHHRDDAPVEGGRWPVSVVLRPDRVSAERLEQVMAGVEALAGPGHFRTGVAGSVHFTVRALDGYREAAVEKDEVVQRCARAMGRAAQQVGPITLDLVGVTLTPLSVMICAAPLGDSADLFMDLLRDELGQDAWREAEFTRDIWYANALHFAADIAAPTELIDWVQRRRDLDLGRVVLDTAELVRFRYEDGADGRLMRPELLATARLASTRQSRP